MTIKLPVMAEVIGQAPPSAARSAPMARAAALPAELPLAPDGFSGTPDDTLLYSLPGGRLFYIPVYEIATETVGLAGGKQELRYRMSLTADGTDWLLRIRLLAKPSPALAGKPGITSARPLIDRDTRLRLSYRVALVSGSFQRDVEFQTTSVEEDGLTATLRLSSLDEQTELGMALTTPAFQARLTAMRIANLRVGTPGLLQEREKARARLKVAEAERDKAHQEFLQHTAKVLAAGFGGISNHVPAMVFHSRWIERTHAFDEAKAELERLEKLPLISPLRTLLPQIVRPDPFSLAGHRYAVQVPLLHDSLATGLIRQSVDGMRYYQDVARPQRFYYLPERFVLGTKPDGWPNLAIQATSDDERYIVSYVAVPAIDVGRLQRHQPKLALFATERLGRPVAAGDVELEPLQGDEAELTLNLPRGPGWGVVARPNVLVNLMGTVNDAVTLTVEELRLFYDALFAADNTLFNGTIKVSIGDWATERIPLVGHLAGKPEEVWDHVFDPSIPPLFKRPIQVVANAAVFTRIDTLTVAFETGAIVPLSANARDKTVEVGQKIDSYILHKLDSGAFRYRLRWTAGDNTVTGDWRTGTGSVLVIAPELIGG